MVADTTPKSGKGKVVTWAAHDIGYMRDVSGPSIKRGTIDVSSEDSTDGFMDFVSDMADGGEFTIAVLQIPGDSTGQKYFLADLDSGTQRQCIITLPDGTSKWTFNALATGWDPSYPYRGEMLATMTMKVTGKPAFTST
jgi:hypothetical protein